MSIHTIMPVEIEGDQSFDDKKRRYFTKLGLGIRAALKMHKKSGLWGTGEDDWRNVSQHCLVTAARVSVLADKLGFSEDEQKTLTTAAALHDFFKKEEIKSFKSAGMTWENMIQSSDKAAQVLKEAGFNEKILKIISLVGLGPTPEVTEILQKSDFSKEDLVNLLLRYVDIYTIGSEWAEPVVPADGGTSVHPLDARINKDTLKYPGLHETGKALFLGEPSYDVFRRNGHDLEARILKFLRARGHIHDMVPEELPYWIDGEIKKRIKSQ